MVAVPIAAGTNVSAPQRTSLGVLWVRVDDTFYYSTNDGNTWTASGLVVPNFSATHTQWRIDQDDRLNLLWGDNLQAGSLKFRRYTPSVTHTAWSQTYETTLSADGRRALAALGTIKIGSVVHVFVSYQTSLSAIATYNRQILVFNSSDALASNTNDGNQIVESDGFELVHDGQGRDSTGDPRMLWFYRTISGGDRTQYFRVGTWDGSVWAWSAAFQLSGGIGQDIAEAFWWDGAHVAIAGKNTGASSTRVRFFTVAGAHVESSPNTTTGTGIASASYSPDKDVYLAYYNGTNRQYVVLDRVALTWGTAVDFEHHSAGVALKRGWFDGKGGSVEAAYINSGQSYFDRLAVFNNQPDPPALLYPIANEPFDRAQEQTFRWNFQDIDANDSQKAYEIRYRVEGTSTWTTLSGGTDESHTFAPSTFALGDYEWQVRTQDQGDLWGLFSASEFFTAGDAPAEPVITDPTNLQVLTSAAYTVTWTHATQDAYQLRRVANGALGAPDTSVVYFDTGTVEEPATRSRSISFPVNNRWEHVQVRVRVAGIWSTWDSVAVEVDYLPPPTPVVFLSVNNDNGSIVLSISNPTPTGGEPAAIHNDVYRREFGETEEIQLAKEHALNTAFADFHVANLQQYEYKVIATADSGAIAETIWRS